MLECFRKSATELQLELVTYAVDLNPDMSSACQKADNAFVVPRCTHPDYIRDILAICERQRINLVIPTIDPELEILSAAADQFKEIGTRIAVSSPEIVRMARNKAETATFLAAHGIPTPRTSSIEELLSCEQVWRWPVILKPAGGSCSVGLHIAENAEAVKKLNIDRQSYIAQEFWRGKEYTVNVFFDSKGEMRSAVPHWRSETRGGEVSKGITQRVPVLMEIAEKLGKALNGKSYGALCFQAIIDDSGKAAVFEINARFGGGYPLTDRAGGAFAKWLLEEASGLPCSADNHWKEGVIMLRYDAAVFLNSPI